MRHWAELDYLPDGAITQKAGVRPGRRYRGFDNGRAPAARTPCHARVRRNPTLGSPGNTFAASATTSFQRNPALRSRIVAKARPLKPVAGE